MKNENAWSVRLFIMIVSLCLILSVTACQSQTAGTKKAQGKTVTSSARQSTAEAGAAATAGKGTDSPRIKRKSTAGGQQQGARVVEFDPDPTDEVKPSQTGRRTLVPATGRRTATPGPRSSKKPSPTKGDEPMNYVGYMAMSAEEQYAYYKTYDDPEDFLAWFNTAKAEYEKENPPIVINPGDVIDLDK